MIEHEIPRDSTGSNLALIDAFVVLWELWLEELNILVLILSELAGVFAVSLSAVQLCRPAMSVRIDTWSRRWVLVRGVLFFLSS